MIYNLRNYSNLFFIFHLLKYYGIFLGHHLSGLTSIVHGESGGKEHGLRDYSTGDLKQKTNRYMPFS